MPDGGKTLLKARPTERQLVDRAAAPMPDGVELYLAIEDLEMDQDVLAERILSHRPCPDYAYVVEGPLRSLDGEFFDLTVDSEGNRETVARLVSLGRRIGAEAAVIHAIAPRRSLQELVAADRQEVLERAARFLEPYVRLCQENGLAPTIEDVPPVAFMREATPTYSLLGVAPEDVVDLCRAVPGLRITLDISHAQLYINATNDGTGELATDLRAVTAYWRARRNPGNLDEYIELTKDYLFEAHISNARGIIGEGLACYDGDLDIAAAARRLAPHVRFLVTEAIEPDPDRSILMREVQRCLKTALAG